MRFKGIVFDIDGLMFDTESIVKRSWDKVGPLLGYGELGDNIYHTLGMNAQRREEYFREKYGDEFPYERFSDLYREACAKDMEENGVPVKTGLMGLLQWIKEQGIPMAVATGSSEKYAMRKLKRSNCLDYFEAIICGNMIQRSKPDPEIYLRACEALGIDPTDALAFEDSPNGIRSALNAGMEVIMVPDLIQNVGDDLEEKLFAKLENLTEAKEMLRGMSNET